MKGTIDVTIKRKNGTEEHQHLHNVVFDYPALVYKKVLENSKTCIFPIHHEYFLMNSTKVQSKFNLFSLSEEECDLTYPKFVPKSLRTTTESSSLWYVAPITSNIADKKITKSATWTIGEAMTIKSIFFNGNRNPEYVIDQYVIYNNKLYRTDTYAQSMSLDTSNYKFTNASVQGLSSDGSLTADYIPYSLANQNEYASYTNASGTKYGYQYPYTNYLYLTIYNKTTDTEVRKFLLTDFDGFSTGTSYLQHTFIINTGTKNWLIQKNNGTAGYKIWQIPDTQTTGTISYSSNTFLSTYVTTTSYGSVTYLLINGNYITIRKQGSSSSTLSDYILKLNDDLSIVEYKGGGRYNTTISSNYMQDNEGIVLYNALNHYIYPYITNYTAANFATPLSLSADDVLTVSYSIEVD